MTKNLKKAILLGLLLWFVIFIAGSIVMTILGKDMVGKVLIFVGPILSIPIAYWYLRKYTGLDEGLRLGFTWLILSIILDTLVLVLAFGNGLMYFASWTVWVGYFEMVLVSGVLGKLLVKK